MKKIIVMAVIGLLVSTVTTTNADVLTFDDIHGGTHLTTIPDGYGGLNWDQFGVTHKDNSPGSGYQNGTVSGNYVAFNEWANVATVSDGDFDFIGAYFTAAWNEGLNINLKGYNNGSLLHEQTVVVDPYAPTWFDFNFNDIDLLVFDSYGGVDAGVGSGSGEHFAMDNFTYVIPEPASIVLIGLASSGIWFKRRLFPTI